ncbi:hypothetical protein JCM14469_24170 [Desulfatiferula olefinivorans]
MYAENGRHYFFRARLKALLSLGIVFLVVMGTDVYAQWTDAGTTSNLRIFTTGDQVSFVLASLSSLSSEVNQSVCGNIDNPGQFSMPLDKPYSDALLTLLISSELAGRSIKVFLTGACFGNRPEINGVQIVDQE